MPQPPHFTIASTANHIPEEYLMTSSETHKPSDRPTGVGAGRVAGAPGPSAAMERLEVFIGQWITEGETVATADAPAMRITASDIYNWGPGGHFVAHPAYGYIGDSGVGGLEVIRYDPATDQFRTHFFDSEGNVGEQSLVRDDDGAWTWDGGGTRCKGVFSDDGKLLTANHERSDHGVHWVPSMTITLRRIR